MNKFTISILAVTITAFNSIAQVDDEMILRREGLKTIRYESSRNITKDEVEFLKVAYQPFLDAKDISKALKLWFDGRVALEAKKQEEAKVAFRKAKIALQNLKPLKKADWGECPDAKFKVVTDYKHISMKGTKCTIVSWEVDDIKEYGVLILPDNCSADKPVPLILYLHGAAYGIPLYSMPWLADMSRQGYAIIAPAMRGEDLFVQSNDVPAKFRNIKCGGKIENLDGEVNDALSAVSAAMKLKEVKSDKFAIVGHSFGGGAGLLTAARHKKVACVVSYDAWLVDPFRYTWDRMRRGSNNWQSWEIFCNQPVEDVLAGLMKRSVCHHAERIHCPLMMFIGGNYTGSVFHKSHSDFIQRLRKLKKDVTYDVVPGGGHNFILYSDSTEAKYAYDRHKKFIKKHLPSIINTPKTQKNR